jgi:DNA replication and repair protein RecF
MDWGVFHVKHEFLGLWRRYHRALQQRNAALRSGCDVQRATVWELELASSGTAIHDLRNAYIADLAPYVGGVARRLVGSNVSFEYRRGWPKDAELAAALENSRAHDLRTKSTSVGPHRADIIFRVDSASARDRVSRGQQKMLAASFVLGQISLRAQSARQQTCLLLDDPAAELDVDNLGKLLAVVSEIPVQLIATAVSEEGLKGLELGKRFHVEQGAFRPML